MRYNINMRKETKTKEKRGFLPDYFRPLLWSYNFSSLNAEKDKKVIILNAINYGDLKHWKWINNYYGREAVRRLLSDMPATELRPRVVKLARLLFSLNKLNYAPRGSK